MNLCNGTRELHKEIVKLPDQHSAKVRPIALEELNKKVHEKAMQLSRCVSLVSLHLPFHVTRAWEHPFQKKKIGKKAMLNQTGTRLPTQLIERIHLTK